MADAPTTHTPSSTAGGDGGDAAGAAAPAPAPAPAPASTTDGTEPTPGAPSDEADPILDPVAAAASVVEGKERGNALFRDGNFEAASSAYIAAWVTVRQLRRQVGAAAPCDCNALELDLVLNFAQAQLNMGQIDAAIMACLRALSLDADNVKALYRLAQAERAAGDLRSAAGHSARAAQLDPTNKAIAQFAKDMNRAVAQQKDEEDRALAAALQRAQLKASMTSSVEIEDADVAPTTAGGAGAAAPAPAGTSHDEDGAEDSSSGDEAEEGLALELEEPYSDEEALRRGLEMGMASSEVMAMIARGEGPLLMAGFQSVQQFVEYTRRMPR